MNSSQTKSCVFQGRASPRVSILALASFVAALHAPISCAAADTPSIPSDAAASVPKDNEELTLLYNEDQSDRVSKDGKPINWKAIEAEDQAREKRVKELYFADQLQTGTDYYHVAMVLQHSDLPNDYLLAHELCVVAISKGERDAMWLAAASEDRFLLAIGRPQRFGTQFSIDDQNSSVHLFKTEDGVTDNTRVALEVPTLADAKVREAMSMYAQDDRLKQADKFAEAEALERQMLELVLRTNDGRIIGAFSIKLAQTLNDEGKYTDAEAMARESLRQRSKVFPKGSWQIFSAQSALGRSLLGQNKISEAEPLLISAYMGLKRSEATIPALFKSRIKDTAQYLVQLYQATGNPAKAAEWKQKIDEFDQATPRHG